MIPAPSNLRNVPKPTRRGFISAALPSLFAAAGLMIHAAAAIAAEPAGDAQSQARSLLLAAPASAAMHESRQVSYALNTPGHDVQAQARSILLNAPAIHTNTAATVARSFRSLPVPAPVSPRSHQADAQESARALILGRGV